MMTNNTPPINTLKNMFEKERKELDKLKRENNRLLKLNWRLEVRLTKK